MCVLIWPVCVIQKFRPDINIYSQRQGQTCSRQSVTLKFSFLAFLHWNSTFARHCSDNHNSIVKWYILFTTNGQFVCRPESVLSRCRPYLCAVLRVYCAQITYVGQLLRLEMSAEWYIAWTKTHENDLLLGLNAGLRRAVVETARRHLATAGARRLSHGTEICAAGKRQWGRFVCGTVHFVF